MAVLETEQQEHCSRCDDHGFIFWVLINSPTGPQRYEIRPGDANFEKIKVKDMCFERCDCLNGNDFAIVH
jgi:hypothetical protein